MAERLGRLERPALMGVLVREVINYTSFWRSSTFSATVEPTAIVVPVSDVRVVTVPVFSAAPVVIVVPVTLVTVVTVPVASVDPAAIVVPVRFCAAPVRLTVPALSVGTFVIVVPVRFCGCVTVPVPNVTPVVIVAPLTDWVGFPEKLASIIAESRY